MTELRVWLALARHSLTLWRSGQLRFRLETFGVYYPALPYERPWWKPSLGRLLLLLHQTRRYGHWLVEMNELRRDGPPPGG